jgi:hypothetical protein
LALLILFVFQQAVNTWHTVDDSSSDGQTTWGRVVLAQPLDPQGAILADSLKFPPLYYLQQAEGIQPDMAIMVLPDEAAYRAELDGRLGAGQTVYLARFLPGLAGVYHLGSVGPLTEVSSQPQMVLPQSALPPPDELAFGSIQLLGYDLALNSAFESGESALTFYWQTVEPVEPVWLVYLRWAGENYLGQVQSQHPANNSYPTNAWRPGEIVADFHSLPWPALNEPTELALQAALAPAFTPHDRLAWQTVTTAVWEPPTTLLEADALRLQVGSLLLDGISMPEAIRPQSSFRVQLHGYGPAPDSLSLTLLPAGSAVSAPSPADTVPASTQQDDPFTWSYDVAADVPPGSYQLVAAYPEQSAVCSWLGRQTSACALGQITVSGAPLPEWAINFDDKIALTAVNIPNKTLQPGGTLAVNLSWLGLSDLTKDYTVFVQVLDEADRIVGQLDIWPLQGTFPTSQWSAGQRLEDPYLVELSEDLPPGSYRLYLGWYLLETFERLPVLDEAGTAVDDKYIVPLE